MKLKDLKTAQKSNNLSDNYYEIVEDMILKTSNKKTTILFNPVYKDISYAK